MHRLFIALGILVAAVAIAIAPSGAQVAPNRDEPERAILGDDDLPNGAPIAAQVKRVCYIGPANAIPNCIFDTIPQCRAECRTKRLHRGKDGFKMRGRVQCILNPALQPQRAQPASLKFVPMADALREH
jgi:hypothetical protein